MYRRIITNSLQDALTDSPVVLLNGARQTGKTTLAQALAKDDKAGTYITLDDSGFLSAARDDPQGLLTGLEGRVIIDEVQHAPELFPAIKALVDRDRQPGRFLLTGSANVLLLPRLSESLAGRMQILTLWPLAQAEIEGGSGNFVEALFSERLPRWELPLVERADLFRRLLGGGYPEPLARPTEARRRAWFGSYLTTILQRDIRDIANIEGLTMLPRLLTLLATRSSALLNMSDVSRAVGLPYTTLNRYMTLLEATFLVSLLPAWSSNLNSRLVKAPKVLLNDTGLIASLLAVDADRLAHDGALLGALLESLVAMEIRKGVGWSMTQPQLFHYRTQTGQEVDLLLESPDGKLVGIEVKAAASVETKDFKGLRSLQETASERFIRGVVLYTGSQIIPFGEHLHAVPVSALWQ